MKKALLTLAAIAMVGSSYAQGTITFANFSNPILLPGGSPADSSYTVGLFKASDLSAPLATTTIFQNTGLFQYDGPDIVVPGTVAQQTVSLTVRAWQTSSGSFAANGIKGEGTFTSQPLGGANPVPGGVPPAFTAPDLTGFQGFTMVNVPEPSTYALGIAGLGALAMMRRRK